MTPTQEKLTTEFLKDKKVALFDIESDNLYDECTKVWCAVIYDYNTKEILKYTPSEIISFVHTLKQYDVIIGHNIIDFDLAVLKKFYGYSYSHQIVLDTLVMSKLMFHNIKDTDWKRIYSNNPLYDFMNIDDFRNKKNQIMAGYHGLEAWGYRLRFEKQEFDDFSEYSEEMLEYCENDVCGPNLALFNLMLTKSFPLDPIFLECEVQRIISDQQRFGWEFDKKLAQETHAELVIKRQEILDDIIPKYDPEWSFETKQPSYYFALVNGKKYTALNKTSLDDKLWGLFKGEYKRKDLKELIQAGPNRVKDVKFNPTSADHITAILIQKYGWKPKVFSKMKQKKDGTWTKGDVYKDSSPLVRFYGKTSLIGQFKPTFDEEIQNNFLNGVEEYSIDNKEEVEYLITSLKQLAIYQDRIEKLAEGAGGGYLGFERNGRLYGQVNPLGTVTHRATHKAPHLGQVPSGRLPYGDVFRKMFKAPRGFKLVGTDADALEMRNLAHYLAQYDGGLYAKAVDEGSKEDGTDPHSMNMRAINSSIARFGLSIDRDISKTAYYCYIYGGGDWKLGMSVGADRNNAGQVGFAVRQGLEEGIVGMTELLEWIQKESREKGYVTLIDGRIIHTRKESAALNSLLQAEGSIICKRWMVYMDYLVKEFQLDAKQVGWIHDECAEEVNESDVDIFVKIPEKSMSLVEKYFNYRCPLKVSCDVGDNWYDVH